MKSPVRPALVGLLLLAACSHSDDGWRSWARWGMTDQQVAQASGGRVSPARLREPGHLVIEEPQLEARLPVRHDGVLFNAVLQFDPRTRRLHTVNLWLEGDKPCADLLDRTLARYGPPDRRFVGTSDRSGMYLWSGGPAAEGVRLNYRPWPDRVHDCVLIYDAPGYRSKLD